MDHTRSEIIGKNRTGENRTTVVENANDVAVRDPPAYCVGTADPHGLAPGDFALLTDATHVHLGVETCTRLRCQEVERKTGYLGAS
jgi:hypothetical protein